MLRESKRRNRMRKKSLAKTVVNVAANVLLYTFVAICVLGVILTITSKRGDDGTATIFGMQMRYVKSPSMEKCDLTDVSDYKIKDIPTNSMVFIEVVPEDEEKAAEWYASLKKGDVLTFKYVYVRQETITHRIVSEPQKVDGGYIIKLEGDNKNSETGTLTQVIDTSDLDSPNYVIGKVVGQNYLLGLFITALRSPAGMICMIILPCVVIVILEVVKIVNLLGSDKRKRVEEEKRQRESEIDELRRKLAELEAAKNGAEVQQTASEQPEDSATEQN